MQKRQENVLRFKENFISIRKNHPERTIQEIASEYGISDSYIYKLITEISIETGIPKETLLFFPHKEYNKIKEDQKVKAENVDAEKLLEIIKEQIKCVEAILEDLNNNIMKGED